MENKTVVYKYCSITKFLKKNILKGEFPLTAVRRFSDPHDGQLTFGTTIGGKNQRVTFKLWNIFVGSFCLNGNLPKMWDRFGDQSKGICFEIDLLTKDSPENLLFFRKVKYTKKTEITREVIVNVPEMDKQQLEVILESFIEDLSLKEPEYSYEQEVRAIAFTHNFCSFFHKNENLICKINKIILGEKITSRNEKLVKKMALKKSIPVIK